MLKRCKVTFSAGHFFIGKLLLLVLVHAYSSLECHLNFSVVHILLFYFTHVHSETIIFIRLLNLIELWLLIILNSQDRMAFTSVLVKAFH